MLDLNGKVALVTGGSRGIGRAICSRLAQHGALVIINYNRSPEEAESLSREISKEGGDCQLKRFDVSDGDQVQKACEEILKEHGKVDILVNNAGITMDQLFVRMKEHEWRAVMEVNLTGVYHCCRALARPMMRRKGGTIINMTSVAGLGGNPGQVNYSASKAGVVGMTKALAKELAPWGIRVNAVAPGYIVTEMTQGLSEKVKEEILGLIPMRRFGDPDDVACVVLFLASEASRYITGEVINTSGGLYT